MSANQLKHIAFIMDGNGRWAKSRNLLRTQGHLEGSKRISEIILACIENNIPEASFFAFSTENWSRPKSEVKFLIKLLESNLKKKNLDWFHKHNVKLRVIGFQDKSLKQLFTKINQFCENTASNDAITVNICFNYSAKQEIINACKHLVASNQTINQKNFEKSLLISNPVDLLIRTSGEQRISNFLLYQIAYSEIIFENTYWPDYTKEILAKNIKNYYNRERRFGKINE